MNKKLKSFYEGKKVLITGHTGFMGGWLSELLTLWGAKVSGYALLPNTNPSFFDALRIETRLNNHFGDIRDYKKLFKVIKMEDAEIIFHLAAQPLVRDSYDDPIYTFQTNVIGTASVLEAIRHSLCVKSAVMITTDKVYYNKEWVWAYREDDELGGYDPYSASKTCAEMIINSYRNSYFNTDVYNKSHNVLISSIRAGNVIGGGDWSKDRLIPDLIRAFMEKNEKVILRNPKSIRPWQHVLEPLSGYLLIGKYLYEGEKRFSGSWNFSPKEENVTVKNIVEAVIKILNKGKYQIQKISKHHKHEANILRLDSSKARELLGWSPKLNITESLSWTMNWYDAFYHNKDMIKYTERQINKYFNM